MPVVTCHFCVSCDVDCYYGSQCGFYTRGQDYPFKLVVLAISVSVMSALSSVLVYLWCVDFAV